MHRACTDSRLGFLTVGQHGQLPHREEVERATKRKVYMAKPKNVVPFYGGKACIRYHKARDGKIEAIFGLVDPSTGHLYTKERIKKALEELATEQRHLRDAGDEEIKRLCVDEGKDLTGIYYRSCRGETKEKADKTLEDTIYREEKKLARLIFRQKVREDTKSGEITLAQFYAHLGSKNVFPGVPDSALSGLDTGMRRSILPIFGDTPIRELTLDRQEELAKALRKKLKTERASKSKVSYCSRALKKVFETIKQYDGVLQGDPKYLVKVLQGIGNRDNALLESLHAKRFDRNTRTRIIRYMIDHTEYHAILYWVALLYAGFRPSEIACATFGEIKRVTFGGGCCYTYQVRRYMRKSSKKYGSISVQNDDFSFVFFRTLVLPPWVGAVLEAYVSALQRIGFTMQEIGTMRLSTALSGSVKNPEELESSINSGLKAVVKALKISTDIIYYTDDEGNVTSRRYYPDTAFLKGDAYHVAERLCGMDLPALHATFGGAKTETDETAYLALHSDEYAIARYLIWRRYSPLEGRQSMQLRNTCIMCSEDLQGERTIKVVNRGEHEVLFELKSNFAIHAQWRVEE